MAIAYILYGNRSTYYPFEAGNSKILTLSNQDMLYIGSESVDGVWAAPLGLSSAGSSTLKYYEELHYTSYYSAEEFKHLANVHVLSYTFINDEDIGVQFVGRENRTLGILYDIYDRTSSFIRSFPSGAFTDIEMTTSYRAMLGVDEVSTYTNIFVHRFYNELDRKVKNGRLFIKYQNAEIVQAAPCLLVKFTTTDNNDYYYIFSSKEALDEIIETYEEFSSSTVTIISASCYPVVAEYIGDELPYIEVTNSEPYEDGGISSVTGGGGSFGRDEVSDQIDVPSGSVAGNASATGMFTRYLVNSSYLDILGDWLWTDDLGLMIAKTVISSIYGNPAESVISLMSYPFNIRSLSGVTTNNQNLFWGNHDSGLSFIALTSQSATIDWGEIALEEYWGNFLDYEPHTKIELYLPWGTGFVSIDPNMCLPGTLHVVTNIDLSKGSCVHNVIGNNNVCIGTYAGQCSQQIPIISNDYASKVAGVVVSATALAVSGVAGLSAANAGLNAAADYRASHSFPIGDVNGMNEYISGKNSAMLEAQAPHRTTQKTSARLAAGSSVAAFKRTGIISRNGSFTDGSAALGVQYPYIILSRPSQSVPEQYGSHYGYPSNIYTRLGNIKGYTEVGEIHLDGIAGTDAEIVELDSILKGGVIF